MHLYILEAQGLGTYKVGITSGAVKDRVAQLRTGCPAKIEVVDAFSFATLEEASRWEKEIHAALKQFCVSGEWFKLNQETVVSLRTIISRDAELRALSIAGSQVIGLPFMVSVEGYRSGRTIYGATAVAWTPYCHTTPERHEPVYEADGDSQCVRLMDDPAHAAADFLKAWTSRPGWQELAGRCDADVGSDFYRWQGLADLAMGESMMRRPVASA